MEAKLISSEVRILNGLIELQQFRTPDGEYDIPAKYVAPKALVELARTCPVQRGETECLRGCGGWHKKPLNDLLTEILKEEPYTDNLCGNLEIRVLAASKKLKLLLSRPEAQAFLGIAGLNSSDEQTAK